MVKSKMVKSKKDENKVLAEIRDLLILVAVKSGATNKEVARLLKCGESTLRKKVTFNEREGK